MSGTLTVTLVNGYSPIRGDSFEVLTAGAVGGEFATVNLPVLTGTNIWQVEYSSTSVRLTVSDSAVVTYQGRLRSGAQLANGVYDFQFRLFDAPTGGTQIAGTQCLDNVAVAEGLFTATFDFGNQYATPTERFFEVWGRADTGLDCSNTAGFSLVGTRQRLLSSPLAAHASSAFALDAPDGSRPSALLVDNAGDIGVGTSSPQATVHVVTTGEGIRVQGPAVGAANGAWVGFRDSTGAETGNVGDASGGDSSIYLTSDSGDVYLYTAAGPALTARVGGSVGIGTTLPTNKLDVRGDVALGSSGQFRAAAADFNLRIIRGVICGNNFVGCGGTILAGSGFTLSHPSAGRYNITFTTPFSAQPSVTATAQGVGDDSFGNEYVMTESVTPTGANLQVLANVDGGFAERTIHFIVVGLR